MWIIFAAAVVPGLLLLYYVYSKDFNPEPKRLIWKGFLYGAISVFVSTLISGPLLNMGLYVNEPKTLLEAVKVSFFGAAIPEESAKLFMLWLLLRNCREFDERYDGIVYAACVGLGFAGFENIGYLMQGLEDGSWISIGVSRALFAVPGHFFFGVVMGFFFGLATFGDPAKRKRNMFLAWFMPMMAHGLYDGVLMSMGAMPEYIAGIMLIVFIVGFNRLRKYSVKLIEKHQNEIV